MEPSEYLNSNSLLTIVSDGTATTNANFIIIGLMIIILIVIAITLFRNEK